MGCPVVLTWNVVFVLNSLGADVRVLVHQIHDAQEHVPKSVPAQDLGRAAVSNASHLLNHRRVVPVIVADPNAVIGARGWLVGMPAGSVEQKVLPGELGVQLVAMELGGLTVLILRVCARAKQQHQQQRADQ